MIVLKANKEQHKSLDGYRIGNDVLRFEKDANDNHVVSENLLNEPIFEPIHNQLKELKRIKYVPKKESDEA